MMRSLQELFKVKEIYIGIAAVIAFQLIFFIVWMTAYDGVNERAGKLRIGLVNEDTVIGEEIGQQIRQRTPFQLEIYESMQLAKSDMNDRNLEMIIQIPASLTMSLQSGKETEISYWINQSNATLAKSIMENTAFHLSKDLNHSLYTTQTSEVAKQFTDQLQQLPIQEVLSAQISESISASLNTLSHSSIKATVIKTNEVEGFAANLVPLMLIISSFVGAMVMIMQHEEAVQSLVVTISKWHLFWSRQIINISVAILLPLLTISLMSIFNITNQESLLTVYLFQFMLFWAFLSLAQMFVLLFGKIGMIFNILLLSLQLVTSGVLVPKIMLSDWYIKVASLLPATYGADGYYTIVFGGNSSSIAENISSLLIIILVTTALSIIAVLIRKQKPVLKIVR